MDQIITLNDLITAAIIFMGIFGFVEVVMKVVRAITKRHDREQAWDSAVQRIADERKEFGKQYDERLNKLSAEMRAVKEEQGLIMEGQLAILDGLGQLKCNGPVTEMRQNIDRFLNERAHMEVSK